MPMTSGKPTWTGAPCTAGNREAGKCAGWRLKDIVQREDGFAYRSIVAVRRIFFCSSSTP
jgi:hypothetical protein